MFNHFNTFYVVNNKDFIQFKVLFVFLLYRAEDLKSAREERRQKVHSHFLLYCYKCEVYTIFAKTLQCLHYSLLKTSYMNTGDKMHQNSVRFVSTMLDPALYPGAF